MKITQYDGLSMLIIAVFVMLFIGAVLYLDCECKGIVLYLINLYNGVKQ